MSPVIQHSQLPNNGILKTAIAIYPFGPVYFLMNGRPPYGRPPSGRSPGGRPPGGRPPGGTWGR